MQDLVCHSFFQQIETKIKNVPISDNARLYPFRAISHWIYSFQTDSKKTFLQIEVFFRDEYKNKNEDVDESSNGFITRAELINKNGVFHANHIQRIDTLSLSKYFPLEII